MEGQIVNLWSTGNLSGCRYSLETLADLNPPLDCINITQVPQHVIQILEELRSCPNQEVHIHKCEEEWPCEVREYWQHIHIFVEITRACLSYGTIFVCALGVFLNGLSFYVLMSSGLAKNGSGFYLVALAVCDTGNLFFNYAIGVARGESEEFNSYFQNSEWLCRFHGVFVEIFQLISAWIVVGFTIERSFVIWYPLMIRTSRRYRSKAVVISCSVIFTLFSLSKLFLVGFEKDSVFGYIPCSSERYVWQGMAYIRVAFQTWIPTILVFTFNCLMFWKLRRINNNRSQLTAYRRNPGDKTHRSLQQSLSFSNRPSPTTPMLVAVSLAYLILVLPLGTVQTVELYWNLKHHAAVSTIEPYRSEYIEWITTKLLLKYVRCFCFAFYQINFTINFFLYCAAGTQFRVHLLFKLNYWWKRISTCFSCDASPKLEENGPGNTSTKTLTSQLNSQESLSSVVGRVLPKKIVSQHKKPNLSWEKSLIMNTGVKKTVSFPQSSPDSGSDSPSPVVLNDISKVNHNLFKEDFQLHVLGGRERLYSDPTPMTRRHPRSTMPD